MASTAAPLKLPSGQLRPVREIEIMLDAKREVIAYIAAMIEQLGKLAAGVGAHTLAYILAQAAEEAHQQIRR